MAELVETHFINLPAAAAHIGESRSGAPCQGRRHPRESIRPSKQLTIVAIGRSWERCLDPAMTWQTK
jgi:hypothetical protein